MTNYCDVDGILYYVACLPLKYRLLLHNSNKLISKSDLSTLDKYSLEVLDILVGNKEPEECLEKSVLMYKRLIKLIERQLNEYQIPE